MVKFIRFGLVNYSQSKSFGLNQENRVYNHAHLEKIKRQCEKSLDAMPPITVNTLTGHIIDGQHRTKAYQFLIENGRLPRNARIKVMYVEIPEEEEKQAIIDANTNSKNWSLDDYIASYAKAGIEYYVVLDNWCKSHVLTSDNGKSKFRYGAAIIAGKRCQKELKEGNFNFTEEDLEKAENIHAEMLEIVQIFNLQGKGSWIESLASSWSTVRGMHDFKTWLKELKAKKQRLMKLPKSNSRDWDSIFSQVHLAIDKKSE